MSFAPRGNIVVGEFVERDFRQYFQYSEASEGEFIPWPEYNQKLWVTPDSFLWCKALKTVIHVVMDENPDGSPRVDRWFVRNHFLWKN